MTEMILTTFNKGERNMKRTLIVIALAMALVFVLASPAFAKYAGYSSTKQYVPWAEAKSMASQNTDAALEARGPHAGYGTTTIKCAVCHSVHRGANAILTRAASGGCAYCHSPAAEGGGAVATNLISWYTPALGPHSGCTSSYCHGGPHGVGASVYAGPASKLLVHAADAELDKLATANGIATTEFATYSATTRALATGAVCGRDGCHSNSVFGVVTSGAEETGLTGVEMVTGHRVIAAATTTWNTGGEFPMAAATGTIAYVPVTYCNSCHDLTDDNNGGKAAFPHGLSGVVDSAQGADGTWRPAVWLTAAESATGTPVAVGAYNDYVGPNAGGGIVDGVCLKCHRGNATTGLGLTY